MSQLKWFSGGNDRAKEALECIEILQGSLSAETEQPLKEVLRSYSMELSNPPSSVPMILSRLNLDISKCLLHYRIELSAENQQSLKKLSSLSQIRVGY